MHFATCLLQHAISNVSVLSFLRVIRRGFALPRQRSSRTLKTFYITLAFIICFQNLQICYLCLRDFFMLFFRYFLNKSLRDTGMCKLIFSFKSKYMQFATFNFQHAICKLQFATCNLQHVIWIMQFAILNL